MDEILCCYHLTESSLTVLSHGTIDLDPLELNFYMVLFNFKDFTTLEIWNFWFRVINNIENCVCVVESSDCVGALPEPS